MTAIIISSGQTAPGGTLNSGDSLTVEAGGTAIAPTIINPGAIEFVYGSDISAIVQGGEQDVFGGAAATNVTVSSGGVQYLDGTTLSTTVSSGGSEVVLAGGIASDSVVDVGGTETVSSGGTSISAMVGSAAISPSQAGGGQPGTTSTGELIVSSAGVASGTNVLGEGVVVVSSGGLTVSTLALSGGIEQVFGSASKTTVTGSDTLQVVFSGGKSFATTVRDGGTEQVMSSGLASGTVVSSAGFLSVLSGGRTISTTLTGGSENISAGVASFTTVSNGGLQTLYSGGTASGTVVSSGGSATVLASGNLVSATLLGGSAYISGTASATFVVRGGELVEPGGVTISTLVLSTGDQYVSSGGTASATTVMTGGGTMEVGGTAVSAIVAGLQDVLSAGTTTGTVLVSGGEQKVQGIASQTVVSSGALNVLSGGTAIGAMVSSGGIIGVASAGSASSATVSDGGSMTIGGTAGATTVLSGGFERVVSGGVSSDTTIQPGGMMTVSDGGGLTGNIADNGMIVYDTSASNSLSGTLTGNGTLSEQGTGRLVLSGGDGFAGSVVISGGTIELTSATAAGTAGITFAAGVADTLVIDGTTMPTNTLSGVASLDTIDLAGIGYAAGESATVSGGKLVVTSGGNPVAVLNVAGLPDGTQFAVANDGKGDAALIPCFCRGTMILTEHGEVAVEVLAVGDRVRTLSGGLKPIVWIGLGRSLVSRGDKLARPVIVRVGALAADVPMRDLYLTHGHALYFAGESVLIPVENLVNHRSILWDDSARVVEYYHIELEDHDVVLANGAPAETYYDADNRAFFQNVRPGSAAGAAAPTFAPVLTGGAAVDRVWTALFARSGGRIEAGTTGDPDLHLVVDGARLDPAAVAGGSYTFVLDAAPAGTLRLRSRSGVPSLLGITAHDHRRLGVAIRRLAISQPGFATTIGYEAPLLVEGGCHPAENGYAWTDGELELPARLFAHLRGAFTLTADTERPGGLRYPVATAAAAAA